MGFLCVICREEFETCEDFGLGCNPNSLVVTPCGHLFHRSCLHSWFRAPTSLPSTSALRNFRFCPQCRNLTNIHKLIHVYPAEAEDNGNDKDRNTKAHWKEIPSRIGLERTCNGLKQNCETMLSAVTKLTYKDHNRKSQNSETKHPENAFELHQKSLQNDLALLKLDKEDMSRLKVVENKWRTIVDQQNEEINKLRNTNAKLHLIIQSSGSNSLHAPPSHTHLHQGELIDDRDANDDTSSYDVNEKTTSCVEQIPSMPLSSDSQFHHSRSFTMESDYSSTTNTSINQINLINCDDPDTGENRSMNSTTTTTASMITHYSHASLGDKVIWLGGDVPEFGIVKWKGFLGSKIHAGVEFENELGNSTHTPTVASEEDCDWGNETLEYYFQFQPGHGRMVPIDELILQHQLTSVDARQMNQSPSRRHEKAFKINLCSQQ